MTTFTAHRGMIYVDWPDRTSMIVISADGPDCRFIADVAAGNVCWSSPPACADCGDTGRVSVPCDCGGVDAAHPCDRLVSAPCACQNGKDS